MKALVCSILGVCFFTLSLSQETNFKIIKGEEAHLRIKNSNLIRIKSQASVPNYIKFTKGKEPSESKALEIISDFFKSPVDFKYISTEKDELGMEHSRYQQVLNGKIVEHAMLILHKKNGLITALNCDLNSSFPNKKNPTILFKTALYIAKGNIKANIYKWEDPNEELFIKSETNDLNATFLPKKELVYICKNGNFKNPLRLAYKLDIYAQEPLSRQEIYIDAANGEVLFKNNLIHTADATGTAVTAYSGNQTITTDSFSGYYRLRETGRGNGIETYNLANSTSHGSAIDFTDADNFWNNSNPQLDEYAGDAHFGAEMTYDYYWQIHGRNSIDGAGFNLRSYVHYGSDFVNAFWDGQRMTYGDGDTSSGYTPLTSMAIAGHEITHGLISRTANLVYAYEPGALNESFADIFGVSIDFWSRPTMANWEMGDEISTGSNYFRSMSNPKLRNDPNTYLGQYWHVSSSDNGGVHTNSGVQNFWYYLLVNGGSGTNDNSDTYNVTGLGQSKAEKIAFRNLVVYLTSNSQYADARFYAIQSAVDLYGPCSPEVEATTNAWYAVGVGGPYTPGVIADFTAPDASGCSAPHTVNFTNLSNNATSFAWDFGDGNTSTAVNPTHTYTNTGTYTITLIADGGSCGIDTIVKSAFVTIDPSNPCPITLPSGGTVPTITSCTGTLYDDGGVTGSYSPNQDTYVTIAPSGATQVTLNFNQFDVEAFTGCGYDYLEIFDGTSTSSTSIGKFCNNNNPPPTSIISSTGAITLHFHSDPGLQLAGFSITWSCNSSTLPPPNAQFTNATTDVCEGSPITFANSSSNATSYEWSFPGGTPATSTATNPVITYNTAGSYDVTLIAINSGGRDTVTYTNYITSHSVLVPSFSSSTSGLSVTFTDLSTGANQWSWDFGDGNTSNQQNPSHTYTSTGNYSVCLTANNPGCDSVTTCQNISVDVTSIDEQNKIDFVKIYPNPVINFLNIDVQFTSNQNLELKLVDMLGKTHYEKIVYQSNLNHHKTIDISSLSKGSYVLYVNETPYKLTKN